MQQYPDYHYPAGNNEGTGRAAKAVAGSMLVFMVIGFAVGIALLMIRNWYLFS